MSPALSSKRIRMVRDVPSAGPACDGMGSPNAARGMTANCSSADAVTWNGLPVSRLPTVVELPPLLMSALHTGLLPTERKNPPSDPPSSRPATAPPDSVVLIVGTVLIVKSTTNSWTEAVSFDSNSDPPNDWLPFDFVAARRSKFARNPQTDTLPE